MLRLRGAQKVTFSCSSASIILPGLGMMSEELRKWPFFQDTLLFIFIGVAVPVGRSILRTNL